MAGTSAGQIDIDLVLQSESFQRQLNNQVSTAMKKVDKQAGGMTGTFGKLGKVMAAAFAVKQIVAFSKECLKLGSDLTEVQNVVDVTFGSMNEEINKFAKNAITAYGLSETVTKKYAGTFGAMAKSFGFAGKDAVAMSETLTGLAGDVASFYNMSTDEAYTKLKSVFTGETESLKELGVVMTQTALDQFALQKGYGKTTNKMTEQEKVALRYAFVLDKLNDASGDFARTSDSWANQTRVLALRFDALKASIGQGLINVLTPVVKVLNTILAKLQVVADAFANFTGMLMGKKQSASKGTAAIAGDLAAAAGNAADTAAGMGDTAAAAKKASKSLMAIDELNTLTDTSDSGSGAGAGAGGIEMPDLSGEETAIDGMNGKLTEMQKLMNEIAQQFKDGFKLGYKDADFQGIINSLKHIGQMVKDIFTAPEVVSAAKNWALTVSNALGKVVGSAARTAVNIGNTLVGGVEKYLEQHGADVKQFIVDMFNITGETATIIGNLSIAVADIFGNVFGTETSKQLVAGILNIFATATGTIMELSAKLSRDVLGAIAQPIIDNAAAIGEAAGHLMDFFGSIVGTISTGISNTASTIQTVYDTYISPMFDALGNGMSKIVKAIVEGFNTYIAPVLKEWGERFSVLWTEHIQPCIDSILVAIGKVCNLIGVLWENYLAPFIAWFIENIYPVIAPILKLIGDAIMTAFGVICDVVTGIMTVLQGALDFLTGVFTLDWGTAWTGVQEVFSGIWTAISGVFTGIWNNIKNQISTGMTIIKNVITNVLNNVRNVFSSVWSAISGVVTSAANGIANGVRTAFTSLSNGLQGILNGIKNFFTNIWNGIVSTVTGAINNIIGMVNKAISAVNSLASVNIGGHKFGLNIPSIPKLATGGYVAANTPQLAMIGDNRTEGEIVAPESKIAQAVAAGMSSVVGQLATALQGGQLATATAGGAEQPINIYLGGELLDSFIVSSNNRRALRSGGRA